LGGIRLPNVEGVKLNRLELLTPLESPSTHTGDGRNRNYQLFIESEVKALPFLTGLIAQYCCSMLGAGALPPAHQRWGGKLCVRQI